MEDFKRKLADYLLQQRIKLSYREGRDISQSEIADRVGIPQGTYNKYESLDRILSAINYIQPLDIRR